MIDGIYLLLGSNLGDKKTNLLEAENAIAEGVGSIAGSSSVYQTAAWGKTDQPTFLNKVINIATDLRPHELLSKLGLIETKLGRKRIEKWGERIIDIDILYYRHKIISTKTLQIPHPGISNRRFTLVPLVEIASDFINPKLGKSNLELLDECSDALNVEAI